MSDLYYKWLRPNRVAPYTLFSWPEPGEWLEVGGNLVLCDNGLHVLNIQNLINWYRPGYDLWRVEIHGEIHHFDDEIVVRRARLIDQVPDLDRKLQSFAAECVGRSVPGYWTVGESADASTVAWDSAWSVADAAAKSASEPIIRGAAWNRAWTAERAWQSARLADYLEGSA